MARSTKLTTDQRRRISLVYAKFLDRVEDLRRQRTVIMRRIHEEIARQRITDIQSKLK